MMRLFSIFIWLCLICCLAPVTAFIPAPHHTITLQFRHTVGGCELQLFNTTYTNPFGEPMTITRFKYYISHISITGSDHKEIILSNAPHLIDEADAASKTLSFPCTVAGLQTLSFEIGVDSIFNVSGVQTGDLDPLKGMFWTWNSGYIFAKLEGKSDSSHASAHYVNWDVGGFTAPNKAYRTVQLQLPVGKSNAADPVITIAADLLKWFNAKHPLKISASPLCHQPGALAMQIADNYSCMFSVAP